MDAKTVCIVGGTGFVGQYVANRLVEAGYRARVLTRRRSRGRDLLPLPRLELREADIQDERELVRYLTGCSAVINCAGMASERRGGGEGQLREAHVELPRRILAAARRAGVPRRLALWLRWSPGLSLLPAPQARLQPVYAGDVARAMVSQIDSYRSAGRSYDLCGPTVYTRRELAEYVIELRGLRRRVVGLSDSMSKLSARLLQLVPGRPFTLDRLQSLHEPPCCEANSLPGLGIRPTAVEAVAPTYLGSQGRQQRYQEARAEAGR